MTTEPQMRYDITYLCKCGYKDHTAIFSDLDPRREAQLMVLHHYNATGCREHAETWEILNCSTGTRSWPGDLYETAPLPMPKIEGDTPKSPHN